MAERSRARRLSVSIAACAAIGVLSAAPAASAASRAEIIATALTSSPLFVDPSESSAFSPADTAAILGGIKAAPVPVYVIVAPVVNGDEFGGDEQTMLTAVEAVLARPGVYVTVSSSGSYLLTELKNEPTIRNAVDEAGGGANEDVPYNSPIGARIQRFLTLLADPTTAHAEQTAREANQSKKATTVTPTTNGGRGALMALLVAGIVIILGVALLAPQRVRRRARGRIAVAGALSLPPQVFEAARTAAIHELHASARTAVVEFGEMLDADDLVPSDGTRPALQALQEALDAYDAAGRVVDDAAGAADLAGVLVLVDVGRDALARAHAAANRTLIAAHQPLCFFNPLHGRSTRKASWNGRSPDHLTVPACAACARDVRALRQPDALRDIPMTVPGRPGEHRSRADPPYYERDRDRNVWAATGYGAFGHDLVQSVLEGHRYGSRARA